MYGNFVHTTNDANHYATPPNRMYLCRKLLSIAPCIQAECFTVKECSLICYNIAFISYYILHGDLGQRETDLRASTTPKRFDDLLCTWWLYWILYYIGSLVHNTCRPELTCRPTIQQWWSYYSNCLQWMWAAEWLFSVANLLTFVAMTFCEDSRLWNA